MPACAATPRNSAAMAFTVGAAAIRVPGSPSLSKTNTAAEATEAGSSALAPCRPISSPAVNTNSTAAAGGSCARSRSTRSSAATAALSSAPRMVSPSVRTTPFSTITVGARSRGTVSRCAQRAMGVPSPLTGGDCGNLIVRLPGRGEGTPIALCAHLDTVPLDRAPTVIVENGVVRTDGETILGADDKAAVAALLLVLRDLAQEPPAAAVEFVFTAGEEIGLQGAKALDPASVAAAAVFVFDSEGEPGTLIAAAPTVKAIAAEFRGVAAHAGIEPQRGRSAIVAAARALAAMDLGRIDDVHGAA